MSRGYRSLFALALWAILLWGGYQRFAPEEPDESEATCWRAATYLKVDHQLCGDDLESVACEGDDDDDGDDGDDDLEGRYLTIAVEKGAPVTAAQTAELPRLASTDRGEIYVYMLTESDALVATLLDGRDMISLCHPTSPSAAAEDPRREGHCSAPLEIAAAHRAACGEPVEWIALNVPPDQQPAVGGFVAASDRYFALGPVPTG